MSYVIKSTGERQRFSTKKIRRSLISAGATKELTRKILDKIREEKFEDIPSKELLAIVLGYLKKEKKSGIIARYDLKRAIMELGPTGFPFENYFALILNEHGYTTQTGVYLKGKNITHEVDIVAKRGSKHMIECKFHNQYGIKTRVKNPLYVYARFLDLKRYFDSPWLATNTKCTQDVIDYARGVDMRITSWDYPIEYSLRELIDTKKLYPITVLRTLSKPLKEELFKCKIFLVRELTQADVKTLKRRTGFLENDLKKIINEANAVMA